MFSRIVYCALFAFFLVFLQVSSTTEADVRAELAGADEYNSNGYLRQAEVIYKQITTDYPRTDYAFEAYKGLAYLYIRTRQTGAATQIISRLTSDYSAHPGLPKALSDLARNSARRRAYEQAKGIYEQLGQQFAGSAYADGAALSIAKVDIMFQIEKSHYAQAETAVGALINDFAGNSALPEVLLDIAGRYGSKRKYKKAANLYQRIVQQWPDAPCASQAQLDTARIEVMGLIRAGFDAQAAAAIDKLCEDFAANPGLPRVLSSLAGRYRGWGKYDKAIEVFDKLIERYPASNEVDRARLNIARCSVLGLIKAGRYVESAAAFDKMIADFSGRWGLRGALMQIAGRYEQAQQTEYAANAYNKIIADYPGSTFALESQKQLVYMQIGAGQFAKAQKAIDKLRQDFTGHADLANSLNHIARRLNNSGQYQQAQALLQQIVGQYPDSADAEEARLSIPVSQILALVDADDHDGAFAAIDKLITDFDGNWHLPWAVAWLGDRYSRKAQDLLNQNPAGAESNFQKAIALYKKVTDRFEGNAAAVKTLLSLANCYHRQGDYEKAQQYYTKLVNEHPESNLAWQALYLTARTYEDMGKAGSLDQQEALVQAKASYQQLLQKYPNCKVAATVQNWLTRHGSN